MKKLYLLFAFLFALIGYQDAGAWSWDGTDPSPADFTLMGQGFDGAGWNNNNGIPSTWDSDQQQYYWDIKANSNEIKFKFALKKAWRAPAQQTLTLGEWGSNGMDGNNEGGDQTVTNLTSGNNYRICVKCNVADKSYVQVKVEEKKDVDPITSVTLTNGTYSYTMTKTGDNWSTNASVHPATGYRFEAKTNSGKILPYYFAATPTAGTTASLTQGSGTFSLSNFMSVTAAIAYSNSDNASLTSARINGTIRVSVGVLGEGVGTAWSNDNALLLDYDEASGEYVRENVPFVADKAFKLLINGTRYGTSGTATLTLNQQWYNTTAQTNDGNDIKFALGGNYTLRVRNTDGQWYVRVTGTQQLTTEWYLCGTFTGHDDSRRIPLENKGDNVHTAIVELSGSGNFDCVRASDSKHFSFDANTYEGGVMTLPNALVEYTVHTTADGNNSKYKDLTKGKYLFTCTWDASSNQMTVKIQPAKTYEVRLVGPGVRNPWVWDTGVIFERQDDGSYHAHGVQFLCNTAFRIATSDDEGNRASWTREAAAGGQNPIIYSNSETPYEAYVLATGQNGENAPGMRLNPAYDGGMGEYDVVVTLDDEGRPSITVYGENNGVWPRVYLYREDGKAHPLTKIDDTTWGRDAFDTPLGKDFRYYIRVDADANTPKSSKFYTVDGQVANANYQVPEGTPQDLTEFNPDTQAGRMRFYLTGEAESGTFRNGVVNATVKFDASGVPVSFQMDNAAQWYIHTSDGNDHVMSATGNPNEYAVTFPLTGNGTFSVGEKVDGLKYANSNLVFNEVVTVSRELDLNGNDCSYNRLTGLNYTFTWNAETHVLTVSFPGSTEYVNAKLNMPLKPADFAGNTPHYFIVGNRMGAWRLQPEWELLPNGDGTYSLKDRLMYTGYFMVAKVDNYADYTKHIYEAYSQTTTDFDNGDENRVYAKNGSYNSNLKKVTADNQFDSSTYPGKWSAILYNKSNTHNQFGTQTFGGQTVVNGTARYVALNFMGALRNDATGAVDATPGDPRWTDHVTNSFPTLVKEIKFEPNNNNKLTFSNMTSDKAAVKEEITFSIVGSAFRHQQYDTKATDARTPRAHLYGNVDDFEQGWQDGYIQFDEGGVPYVDANGEFLYQTVFQANWMNAHPTRFRNKTGFEYSSNGLLFTYDDTRTHSNDFGQKTTSPTETLRRYGNGDRENTNTDNNLNDRRTIYNMDCYVVENVWMRGAFKVWTGWGGSARAYTGANFNQNDAGTKNGAQWNYRNGGHGTKDRDRLVYGSPNAAKQMFATFNDVGGADFAVSANLTDAEKSTGIKSGVKDNNIDGNFTDGDGTRTYFKRIELWWDRDKGFDNSVIRFYQQAGGPAIWISRMDNEHIGYNYNILPETRSSENVYVSKYEIKRYKVGNDGVTITQQGDAITGTYADGEMEQAAFCYNPNIATYCTDTPVYGAGTYRYGITVWYHNDAAGNDPDETGVTGDNAPGYKAFSNDVVFREAAAPAIDARQVTEKVGDVTLYSFDVKVTAQAPASIYERVNPSAESDTRTFAEALGGFKVKLPSVESSQSGNALYTSISVEDGGRYVVNDDRTITLDPMEKDVEIEGEDGSVTTVKRWCMPDLTLHNVIPNEFGRYYTYTVEMIGKDETDAEREAWAAYNAEPASVSRQVVAPIVELTDFQVMDVIPVEEDHPISTEQSKNSDKPIAGGMTGDYIQDYTKFNQLHGEGTFTQLAVTDEVLRDWQVTYDLTLSRAGMDIRYILTSNSDAETVGSKTVPATPALKLNDVSVPMMIDYMNVPYSSSPLTAGPTASDAVKAEIAASGVSYDSPISQTGTGNLTLSFRRRVNGVYSSATVKANVNPTASTQAEANINLNKVTEKLKAVDNIAYHASTPSNDKSPVTLQVNVTQSGKNWYNAFVPVGFSKIDNGLNYGVGFYATNGLTREYGQKTAPYGGEVVDAHKGGYTDRWNINWPETSTRDLEKENFAEVAAEKGYLPIKIHHVKSTTSTKYDATEVAEGLDDAHIVVMTEYPMLMHDIKRDYIAPVVTVEAAPLGDASGIMTYADSKPVEMTHISGQSNRHLTTISIPAYFDAKVSGGTTDIESVEGDNVGKLTLFPNPAVDVVNIRSNAAIGKVEVVSVDGSLVKTADIDDTTGSLDVSDMTSGLYIVRTASGTARLIVK